MGTPCCTGNEWAHHAVQASFGTCFKSRPTGKMLARPLCKRTLQMRQVCMGAHPEIIQTVLKSAQCVSCECCLTVHQKCIIAVHQVFLVTMHSASACISYITAGASASACCTASALKSQGLLQSQSQPILACHLQHVCIAMTGIPTTRVCAPDLRWSVTCSRVCVPSNALEHFRTDNLCSLTKPLEQYINLQPRYQGTREKEPSFTHPAQPLFAPPSPHPLAMALLFHLHPTLTHSQFPEAAAAEGGQHTESGNTHAGRSMQEAWTANGPVLGYDGPQGPHAAGVHSSSMNGGVQGVPSDVEVLGNGALHEGMQPGGFSSAQAAEDAANVTTPLVPLGGRPGWIGDGNDLQGRGAEASGGVRLHLAGGPNGWRERVWAVAQATVAACVWCGRHTLWGLAVMLWGGSMCMQVRCIFL
eukprot:1161274-Pelagomonas_calceolata.AAC.6